MAEIKVHGRFWMQMELFLLNSLPHGVDTVRLWLLYGRRQLLCWRVWLLWQHLMLMLTRLWLRLCIVHFFINDGIFIRNEILKSVKWRLCYICSLVLAISLSEIWRCFIICLTFTCNIHWNCLYVDQAWCEGRLVMHTYLSSWNCLFRKSNVINWIGSNHLNHFRWLVCFMEYQHASTIVCVKFFLAIGSITTLFLCKATK